MRGWTLVQRVMLAVVFAFVCVPPAWADYDSGKQAWDAGKPAEALVHWQAAANAGDRARCWRWDDCI